MGCGAMSARPRISPKSMRCCVRRKAPRALQFLLDLPRPPWLCRRGFPDTLMNTATEPVLAELAGRTAEVCRARRDRLLDHLAASGGVAILRTAPTVIRNLDVEYPYRHDSSFYYLTGFTEPDAWVVLDGTTRETTLFCRAKNVEREIWEGFHYGPEAARERFGFSNAYPVDEL